eukprot:TRINITY_DN3160_c1_g1_i6.p1 TRINITY_DN3160_c1_g1~~TRINITY_DN3160_c1_g1_i6.p1  ORF type:complete len:151 (+),score=9.67 TRINITY_DN3160_c1_g1_i6:1365-1817(+)
MDKGKYPILDSTSPQPQRMDKEYVADVNQQWTMVASRGNGHKFFGNEQCPQTGNRHSQNFQGGQNKRQHRQGNRFASLHPTQADSGPNNYGSGPIPIGNRIVIPSPNKDSPQKSVPSSPTSTSVHPCGTTQDNHNQQQMLSIQAQSCRPI